MLRIAATGNMVGLPEKLLLCIPLLLMRTISLNLVVLKLLLLDHFITLRELLDIIQIRNTAGLLPNM